MNNGQAVYSPAIGNLSRTPEPVIRVTWPVSDQAQDWARVAQERTLSAIAQLPDDWDGDNAIAVPAQTVKNAAWLLKSIWGTGDFPRPDFILPTSAGTITFEWDAPLGEGHLEIGATTYGFYTSPQAGPALLLDGQFEAFDAERVCFALKGIFSRTVASSVANRDELMGYPGFHAIGAR